MLIPLGFQYTTTARSGDCLDFIGIKSKQSEHVCAFRAKQVISQQLEPNVVHLNWRLMACNISISCLSLCM